jgi:hypothetical protein
LKRVLFRFNPKRKKSLVVTVGYNQTLDKLMLIIKQCLTLLHKLKVYLAKATFSAFFSTLGATGPTERTTRP